MRVLLDTHALFWFSLDDAFDRLLIAQALCEDTSVVSADQMFDRYSVRRIW
ncbi:MAG: hypothetical protein K8R46_13125 [Pirellulales bacterium]|nr:hypothetical protein [Pirellulales bacterium]